MANEEEQSISEVIVRFGKCPWCGSTDRMMGRLAKEMVERGTLTEGIDTGTHEIGGPIVDPSKQTLSESIRPGMFALRDICVGCGREITVKIERRLTKVSIMPPLTAQGLPQRGFL